MEPSSWRRIPVHAGWPAWGGLAALTSAVVVVGMESIPVLLWSFALTGIIALRMKAGPGVGTRRADAVAIAGLAVVLYIATMVGADVLARTHVLAAAEAAGVRVQDVMVAPGRGNPFVADVEIRTEDAYVPGTHRWFASPRARLHLDEAVPLFSTAGVTPASLGRRVAAAARERPVIHNYLEWSRYPYVRVTMVDDGWTVRFSDARYDSQPGAAGLAGVSVHIPSSEIR